MFDLNNLSAESTLADLPLFNYQVSADISGSKIADLFDKRPDLPGVLITDADQLLGLVSRRRFHEQISSPYGLEIFFNRPIRVFLEISLSKGRADFLTLPASEKIDTAVRHGLNRNAGSVYEPMAVMFEQPYLGATHHLLDFQTLLLAQSHILARVNEEIEQQCQQNRYYMLKLDEERRRVKQYVDLLEKQQTLIRDRNRVLESQQRELITKNQEIDRLNQRFIQLSQVMSSEGRNAFEATFAGVESISHNTDEIVEVGNMLRSELVTVQRASEMVAHVSYQVRHLATKAAIVANHAGSELSGFSQITEEISTLVGQTYEAGQQIDRAARRFQSHIESFTDAARSGTTVAQSLMSAIARAEDAIAQLEALIQQPEAQSSNTGNLAATAEMAVNALSQTEAMLDQLSS